MQFMILDQDIGSHAFRNPSDSWNLPHNADIHNWSRLTFPSRVLKGGPSLVQNSVWSQWRSPCSAGRWRYRGNANRQCQGGIQLARAAIWNLSDIQNPWTVALCQTCYCNLSFYVPTAPAAAVAVPAAVSAVPSASCAASPAWMQPQAFQAEGKKNYGRYKQECFDLLDEREQCEILQ